MRSTKPLLALLAAGLLAAGLLAACGLVPRGGGPPPGTALCVGVPAATCQGILMAVNRAGVRLVGYRITCQVASCTAASGEAEIALTWEDGMTDTHGYSWLSP